MDFETCPMTLHARSLSRAHVIRRPWKTEPSFRLIQVLEGQGVYRFESDSKPIEQGDFLLLAPGRRTIIGLPTMNIFSLHFDLDVADDHAQL
ncbi:MAG: hypothetical protein JKX85_02925, partial [Phycisphaeraceae bacterium]|nr:hypothetical protein [Phycisphaeraceae bacterium]